MKGDALGRGMSVTGAERLVGVGGRHLCYTGKKCGTLLFRYREKNKVRFLFVSKKFDQNV